MSTNGNGSSTTLREDRHAVDMRFGEDSHEGIRIEVVSDVQNVGTGMKIEMYRAARERAAHGRFFLGGASG